MKFFTNFPLTCCFINYILKIWRYIKHLYTTKTKLISKIILGELEVKE